MMDNVEYGQRATELLAELPEELRGAVGHVAWENGHSAGYEEVLSILRDLVYDLKEPLAAFEKRIRAEYTGPKVGFVRPGPTN